MGIMKKRIKLFIIFISVAISIPSLALLSFAVFALIESNIQYKVHVPSLMHQTRYVIRRNGEVVYLDSLEAFIRSYSNNNYKPLSFFHEGEELHSTGNNSIVYSEKYLAFSGFFDDSLETKRLIQIYDNDYSLKKEISGSGYYDAVLYDDFLYYTDFNNKLVKYDIANDAQTIIVEDLAPNSSFSDGDYSFDIGRHYDFINSYFDGKIILSSYFLDGRMHLYSKNFDLYINHGKLFINDVVYENSNYSFNDFYDNAYLINNKVVFAVCSKKDNEKCGSKTDDCICRFGKSYLFCFDLGTKELDLLMEYDAGTFLIDYDLIDSKYYYKGSFYVNDVLTKKNEKIEPVETIIIKGERRLPSGTGRHYYLSYFEGEFYGA